jgi:branched-chain amino acid transport system substrate-binding protein
LPKEARRLHRKTQRPTLVALDGFVWRMTPVIAPRTPSPIASVFPPPPLAAPQPTPPPNAISVVPPVAPQTASLRPPPLSGNLQLGLSAPITGPNSAFGNQLLSGVNQAVADINAKGGVLGRRLTVLQGDDSSMPAKGVAVARKMVADGVRHVVGPFNSGVMLPVSEVYAENNTIMITPSASNPRITDRGLWNVFRTNGRDDQQGAVAASYIAKHFPGKRVAIIHDKTPFGQGIATEMKRELNSRKINETFFDGVNVGEKDFSNVISRFRATNIDIVYWGGLHTEGALIVRQMRDQRLRTVMMSGDGITSDDFATIAGPGAEGTLMTFTPDPRKRPEAASVVRAFLDKNINPETYTLYSYAAVQVFAQAAETIGSIDSRRMAEHIRSGVTFKTVIGDLKYDKKGDITRPDFVMYTWKKVGDRITYVED